MTAAATTSVTAPIGYAPAETVVADDERPGLLRSPTLDRPRPRLGRRREPLGRAGALS